MSAPEIKGYCPGALHPMQSGDGLVVRIRPFGGWLSQEQASGIATLSTEFGNGILDLSSRANVQLRGVAVADHSALIDGLRHLNLIDTSVEIEQRRNIVVTPFWREGDATQHFMTALTQALIASTAPPLPHKFGFAIDTGPAPVLQDAPADIRLERSANGALLLVAEGWKKAKPINPKEGIEEAVALANWFMDRRTDETRMAKLLSYVPPPEGFTEDRQTQTDRPAPGLTGQGMLCGFAFGQLHASLLGQIAEIAPLRLTPWRMLLIESQSLPALDGLITAPDDPLLKITACTGAPACAQALGDTRRLAHALARRRKTSHRLHVSGCAKGCAHPKPAATTITATRAGYDLIHNGRASDTPTHTGLTPDALIETL